ncbi:hypothetical protein ARALYDRAFT_905086 [Arabidopsis lyrata subsp. lyrata]|uniref:Uncharacterized protein n=1 Tax=Arabidopsis lyrata subsp. lyrata TaxID=81972 RepID=D7LPR4_ARALL|nr:hypothetical protein ARALYDRAFT_905086 [Arabidopsis lyrata subsp. lyrata]
MALSKDMMLKSSELLSAYKSACEHQPDLKSFDSSLQQQTTKVIDSLTAGAETGLSPQQAVHIEVSQSLKTSFDGQLLTTQFKLIKEQQESLFEEVCEAKKRVHGEITKKEKESFITNLLFGAAFAVVAVTSIALIATGAGAVVAFGSLSTTLLAVGWAGVYTALDNKKDALKTQLEGLKKVEGIESSVEKGIKTNEEAAETVSILVEGLEGRIHNMMKLVDNAIENEEDEADTRIVLKLISERVEKLTEKIKEVGESVENHSKLIAKARLQVLQKINRSA